jgi:transcriptional regulator with XRE-family HTH domain
MPPRTRKFLEDLRTFCDGKYGRRSKLARFLGTDRQTITNLLSGRQNPTGEQVLAIQEFLAQEKNKS